MLNNNTSYQPFGQLLKKVIDNRGKTCPTADSGIPLIATNCIRNESLYPVFEKVRFVTPEVYKDWFRAHPESDDIIFVTKGTPGRVCWVPNPLNFCIAQDMVAIRPDEKKVYPKYLFAALRSADVQSKIENLHVGSLIPHFKKGDFNDLTIPIPPYVIQEFVGNFYFDLSLKIDLLHRQNKTLEALTETLFRQWFVEEEEESWEERKLGEALTITSSKRIFYSEYVSNGVPFYRSKEIIELRKTGSTNSDLFILNDRFEEIRSKYGAPIKGDILMTSVGTLGVAYRVRESDKFYFKDGNLTWFKDFNGLPSAIVYLWLISRIGQEQLKAITIGSTQEALTIVGLKGLAFKVPPNNKLTFYNKEAEYMLSKIESNQKQIQNLCRLRDSLLPKLMNGDVRIN